MTTTIEPAQPAPEAAPESAATSSRGRGADRPVPATIGVRLLAALRILVGFMLVWDFFDKTFGLGISTPAAKSWIGGVSPTAGYLQSLHGPAGLLEPLTGQVWVDWAFMLGMLLIGAVLMLGIALRAAAVTGTLLFALLWVSVMPIQNNPFVDEHVVLALLLWVFAATRAGDVWGFGRTWASLPGRTGIDWLRVLS